MTWENNRHPELGSAPHSTGLPKVSDLPEQCKAGDLYDWVLKKFQHDIKKHVMPNLFREPTAQVCPAFPTCPAQCKAGDLYDGVLKKFQHDIKVIPNLVREPTGQVCPKFPTCLRNAKRQPVPRNASRRPL